MASTYEDRINGVATSVAVKAPVRTATTANITLSGLQTVNGVALAAGDRVLVKNQTDAIENGIYVAAATAWTRAIDFAGARDVVKGTRVLSVEGTIGAYRQFVLTTSSPVIGTSSLAFEFDPHSLLRVIETVAAMVADDSLTVGDYVSTKGYTAPGDGGDGVYQIVAAATGTDDGGSYIDLTGITGQAKLLGDGPFCPMQWGAAGDGVTDDRAAIVAMFAHMATLASTPAFDSVPDKDFPRRLTAEGRGHLYAVSAEISMAADNAGMIVRDMDVIAIGSGWETAGGTATTERVSYRPHKSDHLFSAAANATYIEFDNVRLNCNNKCGGLELRARSRVTNCFIKKVGGVGVRAIAGDVWVRGCIIGQWDQNDPEFFDETAFTGIGVLCDNDSDLRVSNCVIRWLHECVRLDGTNCNVWDCHIFNGAENYVASDRSAFSAEMKTAVAAHFGISEAAADTTDFDARTYHAGLVTSGASGLPSKDNSISDVYFDNCHMEHYSDRVRYQNPRLGCKLSNTDPSRGAPDYWWKFYCHTNGTNPDFAIEGVQVLVETVTKELVNMASHDGNSWAVNYNPFEATTYNDGGSASSGASDWADGYSMCRPYVHVSTNTQTGRPAVTFHGPQTGSFIGFSDKDTDLDSDNNSVAIRFGARGDNANIRALSDTIFEKIEVDGSGDPTGTNTEVGRITDDKTYRFPALAAEPAGASNYEIAMSDGTSSTNGFGVFGSGLYQKVSGAWLHLGATGATTLAYATRAAFVSASPTVSDGVVVHAGGLSYVRSTGATAISDLANWLPFGDGYVDHFGENTTPGTTDMSDAIDDGTAWAAANDKPLLFLSGNTYRRNSQWVINTSNVEFGCPDAHNSSRPIIRVAVASGTSSVLIGPDSATNPATGTISTVSFENLVLVRLNPASATGPGFHSRKVATLRFKNVSSWGHAKGWLSEGCTNAYYTNCSGLSVGFTGEAGSAIFKIDALTQTDSSLFKGYTHVIDGLISTGEEYDATVEVASNDFTKITNVYFGYANSHILIRPSSDDALIYNVEITNSYLDDSTVPSDGTAIEIDGNGTTGEVGFINAHGCIFGQLNHALHIHDITNIKGGVRLTSCDIHSTVQEAIMVEQSVGTTVDLLVSGCTIKNFSNPITGYAGIEIGEARNVSLIGNTIHNYGGTGDGANIANVAQLSVIGNLFFNCGTSMTVTNCPSRKVIGNISDGTVIPDIDTDANGTWTPVLTFGGGSTGIVTSGTPIGEWYKDSNGRVQFTMYLALTNKGTSTGNAAISLPFTNIAGRNYVATAFVSGLNTAAGTNGMMGYIADGASTLTLRRILEAGGNETLDDADFTNYTNMVITGFYEAA